MEMDHLEGLNEQQRAAVEYTSGPELVIAGAGSGKTRVLTHKIVHLLRQGFEPWRILALTFTNKAAREMRERIEKLVGTSTASKLWMGTFHSIFYRILRQHAHLLGFPTSFTIYDTADSRSAIKMLIRELGLDEKQYKPATVQNDISWAKNALISPQAYASNRELTSHDDAAHRPMTHEIYRLYMDRCRTAGVMDFDDLLYYTNVLLRDYPEVLRHYQEYFKYVLVDEYQDTNFAQHLIVNLLARVSGNVCVVGDDAQSIYSFRGANIRNILDLKKSWPTLATYKLERNYRSTRNIIDCAGSLIAKNTQQMPKNVYSEGDAGQKVEVVQSFSDYEEAFLVANRIAQVRMASGSEGYDEFAILYRTNAQSRILEDALRKRNIPYRIYGGLSFYQRKEIKDAVAYLRLALNPADDEALKRVINFPARGIGDTTMGKIAREALDKGTSMWAAMDTVDLNNGTLAKLAAFRGLIEGIAAVAAKADAYSAVEEMITRTGLLAMLISDRTPESVSKRENLEQLLAGAKSFVEERAEEQGPAADVSLQAFLQDVSLATDVDVTDAATADAERVTLMTIHAAKGLEFSNVFIVGVEEDLLPSSMCQRSLEEIEEERRLLYVAITRAKKFCMLTFAKSRFRNGMTQITRPSRFLADLNPQYLRLAAGTTPEAIGAPRRMLQPTRFSAPKASAPTSASTPSSTSAGASHNASDLKEGMRIEHSKFGEGTIKLIDTSYSDPRVTVDFDNTGTKTLMLRFARFTIL